MAADPFVFEDLIDRLADRVADRLLARLDERAGRGSNDSNALRTADVARLLSLSPSEVRRQLKSGAIRSVRVGRVRLIPRAAVDDFLQRRAAS